MLLNSNFINWTQNKKKVFNCLVVTFHISEDIVTQDKYLYLWLTALDNLELLEDGYLSKTESLGSKYKIHSD